MRGALGECCGCIPLRQGVMALAAMTLLFSLVELIGLFTDYVRIGAGGFQPTTRVISGVMGALGLVYGSVGILGAYDGTPVYIQHFWFFLVAHLTIGIAIFMFDMVALHNCEAWTTDIPSSSGAYNPTIDEIAKSGRCSEVRTEYTLGWLFGFLLDAYFTFVVWRYHRLIVGAGNYLIHFDNGAPPDMLRAGLEQKPQPPTYGSMAEPPTYPKRSVTSPPGYYGYYGPGGQ